MIELLYYSVTAFWTSLCFVGFLASCWRWMEDQDGLRLLEARFPDDSMMIAQLGMNLRSSLVRSLICAGFVVFGLFILVLPRPTNLDDLLGLIVYRTLLFTAIGATMVWISWKDRKARPLIWRYGDEKNAPPVIVHMEKKNDNA